MIEILDRTVLRETSMADRVLDIFHAHGGGHVAWRRVCNGDWANSVIVLDGKVIGPGEDPRIVVLPEGDIAVSAVDTRKAPWTTNIWRNGAWHASRFRDGKNWAPFITNGYLGFVHSYDPAVVIVRGDPERRGPIRQTFVGRSEAGPDGFSAWRGGTNGLRLKHHWVIGVGHVTRQHAHLTHRPFVWTLGDGSLICEEVPSPSPFSLCDPTSLERHENGTDFWLHTCETERAWKHREGVVQSVRYRMVL